MPLHAFRPVFVGYDALRALIIVSGKLHQGLRRCRCGFEIGEDIANLTRRSQMNCAVLGASEQTGHGLNADRSRFKRGSRILHMSEKSGSTTFT
ncbi:hypothetical protein OB03_10380 [Brevundimonas sp. GN22]